MPVLADPEMTWMTHPSIPGSLSQIPIYQLSFWVGKGWIETAGPSSPAPFLNVEDLIESYRDQALAAAADAQAFGVRSSLVPKPPTTARVVFQFDDNADTDWTVIKPILDSKSIKGSFAVVSTTPGATGKMTWTQIAQLQAAGHEIAAHSRTHITLSGQSAATYLDEIDGSFTEIQTHTGVRPAGFVWPFGTHDVGARTAARRAGQWALGDVPAATPPPFKTFGIARQQISPTTVSTLSAATALVDTAISTGALLIFFCHSGSDLDATRLQLLKDLLDYAKASTAVVSTVHDAMDALGNVVDVGDYFGGTTYLVVGRNGSLSSANVGLSLGAFNPSATAVPSSFPVGVTVQPVDATVGANYPDATSGVLETVRASTSSTFYVKQVWRNSQNRTWERASDGSDVWMAWTESTGGQALNANLATAAPSTFNNGVTFNSLNSVSGTPLGGAGVLVTYKQVNQGYSFQEFHVYNSALCYRRGQATSGDAWLTWQQVSPLNDLVTKTANYTVAAISDQIVVSNGTSLTISLPDPTASTTPKHRIYRVKNINSSSATVSSLGTSKTIDGAATDVLAQWGIGRYVSDGTQWLKV